MHPGVSKRNTCYTVNVERFICFEMPIHTVSNDFRSRQNVRVRCCTIGCLPTESFPVAYENQHANSDCCIVAWNELHPQRLAPYVQHIEKPIWPLPLINKYTCFQPEMPRFKPISENEQGWKLSSWKLSNNISRNLGIGCITDYVPNKSK